MTYEAVQCYESLRQVTNSEDLSPPSQVSSYSASEEIPRLLQISKVHCRIHKRLQLDP